MTTADAAMALLAGTMALGPAYVLLLALASRPRPRAVPPAEETLPSVDVVVAMRDEAALVTDKVREVASLDYPRDRLRVWIVDGASGDGTADLAAAAAAGDPRVTVIRHAVGDKVAQVNAALRASRGDWVLVTDADARLPRDAVRVLVAEALSEPGVAAVGAEVRPAAAQALERLHWEVANALRRLEGRLGATSLVTAPCYLFRRAVVGAFPEDVVADDVHAALAAAAAGARVHVAPCPVVELRAPRNVDSLVRHKFRKTDAYLREVIRFLPAAGRMRPWTRLVFLWRSAHILLFPLVAASAVAVAARWLAGNPDAAAWAAAAAGTGVLAACVLLGPVRGLRAAAGLPLLVAILSAVIVAAMARYPFWRQRAAYPKVGAAATAGQRAGPNR